VLVVASFWLIADTGAVGSDDPAGTTLGQLPPLAQIDDRLA